MLKNKVTKSGKSGKVSKPGKADKSAAKPDISVVKKAVAVKADKSAVRGAKSAKVSEAFAKKTTVPVAVAPKVPARTAQLTSKELQFFRKELLALRDRLTGQVARMRQDSLKRDDEVNTEEDGTDAFDRLFALERAGSEQDEIFKIDESIHAIDEGVYGVCENCESLIERPRLQALPFAKNCIRCQGEMERGRNNGGTRRQVP